MGGETRPHGKGDGSPMATAYWYCTIANAEKLEVFTSQHNNVDFGKPTYAGQPQVLASRSIGGLPLRRQSPVHSGQFIADLRINETPQTGAVRNRIQSNSVGAVSNRTG